MDTKKLLGLRIKEIRKSRGLTQENLAEKVDLETASLSAIESGRAFPSLVALEKIAAVLNVDIKLFFEFNPEKTIDEMKSSIVNNLDFIPDALIKRLYQVIEIYITKK